MNKVLIVYWSMTGNTEAMANALAEGCTEAGNEVTCVNVSESPSLDGYDAYLFGCSSMGDDALDEAEFNPWFTSIEVDLKDKKVALFGSYGWGDGQWMRDWVIRTKEAGANLYQEGLIVNESPSDDDLATCKAYAKAFIA
ncbi:MULTISPECIES: flavodoxin [unclassified Breznakia]|uniref:flavodoxin n=1 Tax=unclassified Breznakia TaxID=2623764 RepID=UPI002476F564|nr:MULTISPECIES: flavodoxin [unclassified Breznakia]MDH6366930.1 flavodoxin I [Breznakia sp. PH1-1]MDH6404108.1 flavodoxin I [Breznakia sp. PF1-11]MDH6411817.1 flavodoxin I [Breznakia sp. PFB1-11]MDH6414096.1 flavodoxin I [Breznakia sp. PFB1-14]MDH6416547.1 flavodoxin I [Breznakia sp. PFB1-4]